MVYKRVGFVSLQGEPLDGTTTPTPDIDQASWRYWCKTKLEAAGDTSYGDGVLLLDDSHFVSVAWEIGEEERYVLSLQEGVGLFAEVSFTKSISNLKDLASRLGEAVPRLRDQISGVLR